MAHHTHADWKILLSALLIALPLQAQTSPMFRIGPEHTGMSEARLFGGQGGVRWTVHTGGMVRSSPAVTTTDVLVGSGDGYLYAIVRASGRVRWKFATGAPVNSSPAAAGGLVIAANDSGRIFAVDERTGALRWSVRSGPALPSNTASRARYDYNYFGPSPVISGHTVVIGMQDGVVRALELDSGRERWRVQTGGWILATPSVHGDLVVLGAFDGRVYGLDLATGASRWTFRTVGDTINLAAAGFDRRGIQSSVAIAGETGFFGSRDDGVYAIDLTSGTARWRISHRVSWIVGSPAVDRDGRLFVGSSDGRFVQALDALTGSERWRVRTGANMQASPLRVGDLVIFGSYRTDDASGELLALDAATGAIRWRLAMDGSVLSSPAAADGELYVGTDAGSVLAVHEVNPAPVRLAVYYDSTHRGRPWVPGGRLAFEYFRGIGYAPLGPDSLVPFLSARITDGIPNVVVFASDLLPGDLANEPGEGAPLIRRYLEAGGKAVWLSLPVGILVRDSLGRPLAFDLARAKRLTGVEITEMEEADFPGVPTPDGVQWGLGQRLPGRDALPVADVDLALTRDQFGRASAWVKRFRADRPWAGYVQLWGLGATLDRLPLIRAVAEYGLLRRAAAR